MNYKLQNLLETSIRSMFEAEAFKINKKFKSKKNPVLQNNEKSYSCIHFSISEFLKVFEDFKKIAEKELRKEDIFKYFDLRKFKFLDVGCGTGQKVYLAKLLGMKSDGLDFRKEFVNSAQELLKKYDINIKWYSNASCKEGYQHIFYHADAIEFINYKDYDVIYFYRPISDDFLYKEMEKRIIKDAKVGAYVICVYNPILFFEYNENQQIPKEAAQLNGWKKLNDRIWRKMNIV